MSEGTKIQWTDATWNPWIGCTKVSPGCKNCYAENSTPTRVARSKGIELWGGKARQRASEATFNAPTKWNEKPFICEGCGTPRRTEDWKSDPERSCCPDCIGGTRHRRRVFSLSLGDWLDPDVPIEWLADFLDVVRRCPELDFLLLTKRPENWMKRLQSAAPSVAGYDLFGWICGWLAGAARPNVWIGCTVENQEMADKRIPELLKIPAVCRFLSVEPMLGAVSLKIAGQSCTCDNTLGSTRECSFDRLNANGWACRKVGRGIHWVIVGGESGPGARPFNVEWGRSVVRQCREAGVACFVKQLGSNCAPWKVEEWSVLERPWIKDKKGGDISEWPEDLRVREWPKAEGAR